MYNSRRRAQDSIREAYVPPHVIAEFSGLGHRPAYAFPRRYDPFAEGREALMPGNQDYMLSLTGFDRYRQDHLPAQSHERYSTVTRASRDPEDYYNRREKDMMQGYNQ